MWSSTPMLVLGFAAATFAQQSDYTGPMFNPSDAAHFDYSSLVIPTQTTLPAIEPTQAFSMATTIPGIIVPSTMLRSSTAASSASHSSSQSASSASSSASRTASSSATSASASVPAQQSTAAGAANRAGVVGAVAGGLLAGLALA